MKVGLLDLDGKLPNLALMKLSTYHKGLGDEVVLNQLDDVDQGYMSVVFERNQAKAKQILNAYPNTMAGGPGWDLHLDLLPEIDALRPDYDLYTAADLEKRIKGALTKEKRRAKAQQIVDAGIGFTSRGCIRRCGFCIVPVKEGQLRQDTEIKDIINPRSNVIILLDNNLSADPHGIEKLHEIRDRGLIVDITQGIDVRLMTPEFAQALSEVKHLRSIHYAWDLMPAETRVLKGIKLLAQYVKAWRHLCFMLVGFDTSFEEDMYRFRKLRELRVDPYVMIYNQLPDVRLKHFARWVNGRVYKKAPFEDYLPWMKARAELEAYEALLA